MEVKKDLRLQVEKVIFSTILDFRLDVVLEASETRMAARYISCAQRFMDGHFPGWRARYCGPAVADVRCHVLTSPLVAQAYILTPVPLRKFVAAAFMRVISACNALRRRRDAVPGATSLADACAVLSGEGVIYFADFSTLKKVSSPGKKTSFSVLEFGVVADEVTKLRISQRLLEAGFVAWREYIFEDSVCETVFHHKSGASTVRVVVRYYTLTASSARVKMFYSDPTLSYAPRERSVAEMRYSSIDGFRNMSLLGVVVPVPQNAQKLLSEKYGAQLDGWTYWRSPFAVSLDRRCSYVEHNNLAGCGKTLPPRLQS